MKTLVALTLVVLGTLPVQDVPQPATQLEQHAWLQQLVGEWNVTSESIMEPGGEKSRWKSTESTRSFGGLWVLSEGSADMDGQTFHWLMTLGYDPAEQAFVGSWVDTLQTKLWTYVGQLDEAQRVLTLEAEGPGITDPSTTSEYRDQVEIVGPDERRMTSSMLGDDGTWTVFMTATYQRAD